MSDYSRVMTRTCSSNFQWSRKVKGSGDNVYTVWWDGKNGFTCSCPGFTYRGKCKHVDDPRIQAERCGWGYDAFAGTVHEEKVCPDCGAETTPFYCAV